MATRKVQKLIYNTVIICLLAVALIYVCSRFVHPGVEYTDNAQVKQHITPVNTRVQGFIKQICFEEYQPVHKGDTLVIIEDSEFESCDWLRRRPILPTRCRVSRLPAWASLLRKTTCG